MQVVANSQPWAQSIGWGRGNRSQARGAKRI